MAYTAGTLIPLYNSEAFLVDLAESIKAQTRPLSQVVLINDGSTDRTGHLAHSLVESKAFGEAQVTLINLEKNTGISTAFNIGLAYFYCQYLFLSGHDDVWSETRVEKMYAESIKTNAAVLHSAHKEFGFSNKVHIPPVDHADLMLSFLWGNRISAPTLVFDLERVPREKIRLNPRLEGAEDYDLTTYLISKGYLFKGTTDITVFYRRHSKQLSVTHNYRDDPVHEIVRSRYTATIFNGFNSDEINLLFLTLKVLARNGKVDSQSVLGLTALKIKIEKLLESDCDFRKPLFLKVSRALF